MNAEQLRARLAGRVSPGPPIRSAREALLPPTTDAAADASLLEGSLVPAAVLVPLLLGPAAGVLLTKRCEQLPEHSGQVCFPGGRIDATDPSPEAAALREAQEEIGLDPARVELLGRLGQYVTGTGYSVTPVVGALPVGMGLDGLDLVPSPDEVEAVFILPLAVLLDPAAPRRRLHEVRGRMREFWVWPHPEHYIWGATAAILVHLATLLRGE
jgi:8-oxo-dGTP pyrophosphatase MutT (NUDIX family)